MSPINRIIDQDEEFYDRLIREADHLKKKPTDQKRFIQEVGSNLINEINRYIYDYQITHSEYLQLGSIVNRWKGAISVYFGPNKENYSIDGPRHRFKPDKCDILSYGHTVDLPDDKLEGWVKREAFYLYEKWYPYSNPHRDIKHASVYFASLVIEGKISFASQIQPKSYFRLEGIWLKDVKELMAYSRWKRKTGYPEAGTHLEDYYTVCTKIRLMLTEHKIQSNRYFDRVREYLMENYLDSKKKLDESKDKTKALLKAKAERIWETGGRTPGSDKVNWDHAEEYMILFYENIIPAVVGNDRESTKKVLEAFQFSKSPVNRYLIINCFEAAVAINFLNPEYIKEFCRDDPQFLEITL